MEPKSFEIIENWSVSRTTGYNVCTWRLGYSRGRIVAKCDGGGYDMSGTNLGHALMSLFPELVNEIDARVVTVKNILGEDEYTRTGDDNGKFYGATKYVYLDAVTGEKLSHNVHLDGACGWDSVCRAVNSVGIWVKRFGMGANSAHITLFTKEAE
jgi:hypothetical protein